MATDIEHFWPKADYPAGAFCWQNYLLACSYCNSNLKREQFPRDLDGEPLLVDPTVDDPTKYLLFLPASGEFKPVGPKGEATESVFGLNDDNPPRRLPSGRRDAFVSLIALLERYDRQISEGHAGAKATRDCVLRHPFSSVLVWLLATAAQPGAALVLGGEIVEILVRHDVGAWLEAES